MLPISFARDQRCEDARLRAILLQELARLTPDVFPGVEAMSADQVLQDYSRWVQQGAVPAPEQLAGQYPELAAQIYTYFAR